MDIDSPVSPLSPVVKDVFVRTKPAIHAVGSSGGLIGSPRARGLHDV